MTLGRTHRGLLDERNSSLTVENVVEEMRAGGLEHDEDTEDHPPTPLGMQNLSQPKLTNDRLSKVGSSKKLLMSNASRKKVGPKPSANNRKEVKRNSALEKTNGGVEPWLGEK